MTRYEELISYIKQFKKAIVAFSGGIDSYFVLKASNDSLGKDNVMAVTGDSPSLKRSERELTIKLASVIGANHKIIFTEELMNPDYYSNPGNRCFFCKDELYNKLSAMKNDLEFAHVLDGTNFDDLSDYRPGYKASRNHGIRSPLADLKFTKKEIRDISHQLGLEIWNKPASPCLSSRIPYGQQVTREKLAMIEKAENVLKELGFIEYRIRHFESGNTDNIIKFAKIEISKRELEKALNVELFNAVDDSLKNIGYNFVTLDMGGLKSGSLNKKISIPILTNN